MTIRTKTSKIARVGTQAVQTMALGAVLSVVTAFSATAQPGRPSAQIAWHQWSPSESVGRDSAAGVTGLSQMAVPLSWRFGATQRVSFDIATAAARTQVTRRLGGVETNSTLSGLTDTRVLLTATALDERLAVLVGANIPTGKTKLNAEELIVLGTMAAPAVAAPVAAHGIGTSLTAGLSATAPMGTWNITGGVGYEQRQEFSPFYLADGVSSVSGTLAPGNVLTLSARLDGDIGDASVVLDGSVRQFDADFFAVRSVQISSSSTQGNYAEANYRLGPIANIALRVLPGGQSARDLAFTAQLQHRRPFESAPGVTLANSGANLMSAGLAGTLTRRDAWRLGGGFEARRYTGIDADTSLVAAALTEAVGSLQFVFPLSRGEFALTSALGIGTITVPGRESVGARRLTLRGEWRVR
ncbi:MAG: hypothetical protein IBJ03_18705 [Gemmatimonadaceae bacterium]|nr:hypothetical protein [Gemmatimonadaceae bacterium]